MPAASMSGTMSDALDARRQGQTSFDFSKSEPAPFTELEELTA